ncbi:MAG: nucleotidyltransferase domain-containing protein [Oligoflexia bacterium]|nr:nucleotidyltransferase domain-containing protein [Oligoflexia bacterium]
MDETLKNLSETEKQALAFAIQKLNPDYSVFLFGSRVEKKGGDIDILIMAPDLDEKDRFSLSLSIGSRFKSICDEKIDVIIFDPNDLTENNTAFLTLINKKRISLPLQ